MLRCLSDVENLTEAISALGKADFTGVAALEITGDMKRMRWEVINPWHLCRPSIHAPWMYNANVDPVPIAPEMLEAESVILREALPMHLPAMFLIVAKRHGVQAWDAFLDKFGIPAAFFETPPGATEEEALEFDATVQKLIGEGSGTIPNGAKLHTFETSRDNTQTFEARARWCDDALLQLILGGKLTMATEAGSGTLAGNAHQESFERLCAATARSISECINRQFCRRILREAFPDQPQLALFDLSAQKQEDLSEQAQLIATLSSAGFRPSPETVSEMMGFEVEAVEPTQPTTPFSPGLQPITNRETDSTTPDTSAPLTEQELAALQSLSKGFAADQLEADADTIYTALADAVTNSDSTQTADDKEEEIQPDERGFYDVTSLLQEEDDDEGVQAVENTAKNYGCRAKDPSKCRYHGGFWHPATQSALNKQPGGTTAKALNLPKMTAIKGDKVNPLMKLADARKYMNSGNCKVRSVDGDWVEFDHETCRHIEMDHQFRSRTTKGLTEGEDRLQKLADAMRTVVRPHEIWEELDASGNPKAKLYLRVYEIGPNKKKVTLGVRWESESHRIHTYYDISKPGTVEKKRAGKLLYKRDQ